MLTFSLFHCCEIKFVYDCWLIWFFVQFMVYFTLSLLGWSWFYNVWESYFYIIEGLLLTMTEKHLSILGESVMLTGFKYTAYARFFFLGGGGLGLG